MAVVNQVTSRKQSPVAQKTVEHYIALSEALNAQTENQVLVAKRVDAQAKLRKLGLPTRRDEDWQYTSLNRWMQHNFSKNLPGRGKAVEKNYPLLPFETYRFVFVDGVLSTDFTDVSSVKGLVIESNAVTNADLMHSEDAFEVLHDLLVETQFKIKVLAGVVLDKPIELVYLQTQPEQAVTFSVKVQLEQAAQATLIQQMISENADATFLNGVTQVIVGNQAVCKQFVVQDLNEQSFYFHHQHIQQQAGSVFESLYLGLGSDVSRHQNRVGLCGERAESFQNSIVFGRGNQTTDSRTETTHTAAHCQSQQLHKFVLDDQARGVFNGMIYVAKGAQKTDGQMDNKNLLLSNEAKMDTKPQLEIYADDVKCSHGCASGQIDENQIFYCQARGIRQQDAVQLITKAFLLEPLDAVSNKAIQLWLTGLVNQKLASQL